MSLYRHVPHPHVAARKMAGPVKVGDERVDGAFARFNKAVAIRTTTFVGSMVCAYIFCLIALISLPSAIGSGNVIVIVSWVAQTFLQLVLLSIILLGTNLMAAASDKRSEQTYLDAEAVLHEATSIQKHLEAQDRVLEGLVDELTHQKQ